MTQPAPPESTGHDSSGTQNAVEEAMDYATAHPCILDTLCQRGQGPGNLAAQEDDTVISEFARALSDKMAQGRDKGRSGWQTCPVSSLWQMLGEHVEKGDPRDVALFAMMIWHNSQAQESGVDAEHSRMDSLTQAKTERYKSADTLLQACESRLGKSVASGDERELLLRNICIVLIAVSQALDRELPPAEVIENTARLLVGHSTVNPELVVCRWSTSPDKPIYARAMMSLQATFAGEISQSLASCLGDILAERLVTGEFVPDGFVREEDVDGMTVFKRPWLDMDFS